MPSNPLKLIAAAVVSLAAASTPAAESAHSESLAQEQAAVAIQQLRLQAQQLEGLKAANAQQQQTLTQMQSRLSAAESIAAWLPWLALALVGSGALSVWLALRARSLQADRDAAAHSRSSGDRRHGASGNGAARATGPSDSTWRISGNSGHSSSAGLAPMVAPSRPAEPVTVARPAEPPVAPPRAPSPPPMPDATRTFSHFSLGTGVPPREVSVEELLDLEQQVDFFVVLGQDEAAIDLLVGHIRATGGTSALPYLKLMEIYHRRGNADDYERTRTRFNKRFSAKAPAWGGDPTAGRTLDDYPEVIELLQLLWPMPLKAQRELDALMHPSEQAQGFDLPAFHDLLTLHGVVGDLLGHPEPVHLNDVDIMLPLSDDLVESTSPQPRLSTRPPQPMGSAPSWSLPAMPEATESEHTQPSYAHASRGTRVDLDLSDFAPAPREFTEPAAFTDMRLFRDRGGSNFAPLGDDGAGPPKRPS